MQSPDFIIPSDEPKDKALLTSELKYIFDGIATAAKTKDLYAISTGFEMPVLGSLTRTEFIHFTIFHTKRHIHQLKNIRQHLKN